MALVGGSSGWNDAGEKPGQHGVFLLVMNAGGRRHLFSTADIVVQSKHGPMRFPGGITQDHSFTEAVNVFDYSSEFTGDRSMSFAVSDRVFPLQEVRRIELLQDVTVEVRWTVKGLPVPWEETVLVLRGRPSGIKRDEPGGLFSFTVEDGWSDSDDPFKVMSATKERLPNIREEDAGRPYPVVFGAGVRVPALDIGIDPGTGGQMWLAAGDPFALLQAGAVTYIGNGDDVDATSLIASQGLDYDAEGNPFWKVVMATTGFEGFVTDIQGYPWENVPELVRRLCAFFTEHRDLVDLGMLEEVGLAYDAVACAMVINDDPEMNMIRFVQERIGCQLALYAVRHGPRYAFRVPKWDTPPAMVLSTRRDIIRKVAMAEETERADVVTSYSNEYGNSGKTGDQLGSVELNHENMGECLAGYVLVGGRRSRKQRLADISDVHGATASLRWQAETNSKIRVTVSYECSFRALRLTLLDNVRVEDLDEGWGHMPRFKVVGLGLGTGETVRVDLVSVGSVDEVYDVNRAEAELGLSHHHPVVPGDWGDGLPGGTGDDGPHGIPDF